MSEPSGAGPQYWIGRQVRVELVRPGGESLIGKYYFGDLVGVTDLGIVAALVEVGQDITRSPSPARFYP